ncbi:MAG: ABC transporter permease, partial [Clostridia bacterium]|nr:ABC transporter permease [Clostridia bacterium]
MNNFGYHLKEGVRGVFRNRLVNTAAIGMLIACLVVTGAFGLLLININAAIEETGAVNMISVYLDETADAAAVAAAGEALAAIPGVKTTTFVSKAEGLESMRETFGDLIDGLEDDNPIRDLYRLEVEDQSQLASCAESAKNVAGVAKVNSRGDVAVKFLKVRNTIAMIGLAFVVVLGLISLFILSNAVRLSVFARRTEVRVMKTVGATNSFIRASFAIEGVLLGLIGAAISYGLIALAYVKLFETAIRELGFLTTIPLPFSTFAVP